MLRATKLTVILYKCTNTYIHVHLIIYVVITRILLMFIGWGIFFAVAHKASKVEIDYTEFDPYQELGIDRVSFLFIVKI